MKTKQKRDGFYMNVTQEEREIIKKLKEEYALSLSSLFKIFLKKMLKNMEDINNESI